jgi:hypothetical protein
MIMSINSVEKGKSTPTSVLLLERYFPKRHFRAAKAGSFLKQLPDRSLRYSPPAADLDGAQFAL